MRCNQEHSLRVGTTQRTSAAQERRGFTNGDWWQSEPSVGRLVNGLPARLDDVALDAKQRQRRTKDFNALRRAGLHALGNSIVPQIAEELGRMILAVENAHALP